MTRSGRSKLPTSTCHLARLQIFQATRRPRHMERVVITPWGQAEINGRLGQGHADYVEAIFSLAEKVRELDDGRLQLLVDPAAVRRLCGGGKPTSQQGLKVIENDVIAARIKLFAPKANLRAEGQLIEKVEESPATRPNPFGGFRNMWRVTVGGCGAELLNNDIHCHYGLAALAGIRTGVGQAVARLVLTHKNSPIGGWKLDTLISAVGENRDFRNRRREIRKISAELLLLGIVLWGDQNRVFLKKKAKLCSHRPIECARRPDERAFASGV